MQPWKHRRRRAFGISIRWIGSSILQITREKERFDLSKHWSLLVLITFFFFFPFCVCIYDENSPLIIKEDLRTSGNNNLSFFMFFFMDFSFLNFQFFFFFWFSIFSCSSKSKNGQESLLYFKILYLRQNILFAVILWNTTETRLYSFPLLLHHASGYVTLNA